jgi:hypothetical protein
MTTDTLNAIKAAWAYSMLAAIIVSGIAVIVVWAYAS